MTAETEQSLSAFARSSSLTFTRARFNLDIVRVRSWCAHLAVEDGFDILWSVDHDVGFSPDVAIGMYETMGTLVDGKPVEYLAAPYPKRNINLGAIFKAGWDNAPDDYTGKKPEDCQAEWADGLEQAAATAYEWPHITIPGEQPRDPGIIKVAMTGMGMTMIATSLLKRMNEKYGEYPPAGLRCANRRGNPRDPVSYKDTVMLFHQIPTRHGLLSEDHSFCVRAAECGADLWLWVRDAPCSHTGSFTFRGDLREVLR